MVPDEKTAGMRKMNMGRRTLESCPNDYKCSDCDIEQQFIKDIKNAIAKFRNTV
jgi:hypothetical protein